MLWKMIIKWCYSILVVVGFLPHFLLGNPSSSSKNKASLLPELVSSIVENEITGKMPHEAAHAADKHGKRSRLTGMACSCLHLYLEMKLEGGLSKFGCSLCVAQKCAVYLLPTSSQMRKMIEIYRVRVHFYHV